MSTQVDFSPLRGGRGILLMAAAIGPDLTAAGYSEAEYLATGTASGYRTCSPMASDGRFDLEPDGGTAHFATRVVVRRPADAANFNGTLVVEWLNVSSGQDAGPDYSYMATELVRGGYAWVGVSAQWAGIEGGTPTIAVAEGRQSGLAEIDPDRYGGLHHPGDAYCYDIYTKIARSITEAEPLAGLHVDRRLAIGESQSAIALSTYINGVQPLTELFDGFLVHSRGGAIAPLGDPGRGVDLRPALRGTPTQIRDDIPVPVIVVQTETDLFGHLAYYPARQEDSNWFRLWEIAGTAHADRFQIGQFEKFLQCRLPVNRGQQVFVLRAALRALDTWVRVGQRPPSAPRLEVVRGTEFAVDANGNVLGGVRTPAVDAPVAVLSGAPAPGASPICELFGTTTPLPGLDELYVDEADYLAKYTAAADAAIEAGFVLAEDRAELLAAAEPELLTRSTDPV
ncbi:alpha/beta hydrolase domain-containing protein [Antrihabitans sp. YC2-6]|uniref:alpha/beta hydrolase domain-containing protein n=1 Tax=Antrihabitans sp. YC2-6 TaxID=2799498 RepID=UPI0018F48603|nr:alpha/beta hydrolase domain-containing protein [Antrihabitans sp. YC2-6]MBJ8345756.1 hypothetical protein [Antrihabitans sp. YC2-6]